MCHSQQASTRANDEPNLRHHMGLLGHNELTNCDLVMPYGDMDLNEHCLG